MAEPEAGWYDDPGGEAGKYRYWDGSAWGTTTTSNPSGRLTTTDGDADPDEDTDQGSLWQQAKGPLLLGSIVLVTIIALIWALVQSGVLGGGGKGASNPQDICPPVQSGNYEQDEHPADGRVHGGALSFPRQGAPWGSPKVDGRVPFGRDTRSQDITIEAEYQPGANWVASLLVAELIDGDGVMSPEEGIDMVAKCIVGAFYGDNEVTRRDVAKKSTVVDGRAAAQLEMHLTFDIPGLEAKGETAIIVIVAATNKANSLYYASIPDNAQEHLPTARRLIGELRVAR